jgi:serine/threonine protein kinase
MILKPHRDQSVVALKILRGDEYAPINEGTVFKKLQKGMETGSQHPGIVHMIDYFELTGPNGIHLVLVLEPLADDIGHAIFYGKFSLTMTRPGAVRLPFARKMVLQLLEAIQYVHSQDIIHGGKCRRQPLKLLMTNF